MIMNIRRSMMVLTALSASMIAITGAQAADQAQATAAQGADDAGAAGVGDIVVTAQKRSESLQKVPLAITAVTAADLDRSGIRDLQGIVSSVPNLNLGAQLGMAKIALRGIGLENISSGAEGSIAFHMNGVFLSRTITALASFYDVQQVEVLRGPQGTLYGRNATGGAVNITTRTPTEELTGYFNLTGGNYSRLTAEGAVSGAIVPGVLAARLAFQTQNHDGYGRNIVTGNGIDDLNSRAVRGSLLFTPGDRVTINIVADYFHERDHAGGYHVTGAGGFDLAGNPIVPFGVAQGGTFAPRLRDISNTTDPTNYAQFWGVSGKISYDLTDDIQLSSLTAYRKTDNETFTDLDGTELYLTKQIQFEHARQFSEELQLSGKADRLNWLIGGFYFHEKTNGTQADPFNPARTIFFGPDQISSGYLGAGFIKTDALALFGQASYAIVDNLRLTLGARYSSEKKTDHDEFAFDIFTPYNGQLSVPQFVLDRSKRFKSFTPRIALDYQATPDVLLYASWSKGFKAGTYSLGSLTPPVDPEKVDAYEAGVKSSLFDRRLRLNLAGFYYDYKDLQIGKVTGTGSATLVLENAGTARIYGLEAELKAQISPAFDIDANASWLHARFTRYCSADPARPALGGDPGCGAGELNLKGNSLSQAPDFTAYFGAQYHVPSRLGEFTLRGEVAWRDRVYFTPFNLKYVSQAANAKVNAFLNWAADDGHWTGSLFVKNLTNKTVVGNALVSSSVVGFPLNGYLEDPRTYGLTLGYKF
ncbi:TonB-dependent receptor [Sphingomonas sp. Root710]|uniref:TonB-dependent receptor n=1 Tax=Sphingomonas sp. Root710 TaxID=1736594 RepID=UPI0006FADF78|nr:TonB-dependent receptor [Sphingomonas sp. Root710]KRB82383.1 TonB-dependent receptor [Sphingomonas sp. Root710]